MTLFAWQKETHWHDPDHQFLSNWGKKPLNKLFGALRGFKPWTLQHGCDALPTEL